MINNKALVSFFLASLMTGCSPSVLPSANLNMVDVEKINQSGAFNDAALQQYQADLSACGKGNEACQGKVMFSIYDTAFTSQGFSQIKTAISYSKWMVQVGDMSPTRDDIIISQNWGQLLMGSFMCISHKECSDWLLSEKKVTKNELDEFKALVNKLN
ncbi:MULTISPECIES: hypothetical protein [Aliivibrio]|uniref:Lipoprotein n=1 Tax=Aliivibrio finisterrensis TaxID=511998 RepID=A0A4Q5KZ79_9GAMM|nr:MULTISPECIES: hypothetical protein [Aliivibrio]MDD9177407.1 hypothetical protein [Aliivibrio sp. A6]RYU54149.1 hypothetical protein ERW57_02825 [Aliivibrio finisterrensis]RYU56077.1 hypothetical protein ERW56_01560 [Aliivibrio finisterrensis]RYU61110.1 hypothetical protein ERW50_02070 [Aliivibrio finisterrensis]RYU67216.1 hypothetical protein ERW53_00860 [Aliivibrio finisterrensis]